MAIITTSRNPSRETRKTAREIAKKFSLNYFNRSKKAIYHVIEKARFLGEKWVVVVNEKEEKPDSFQMILVTATGFSYGPLFSQREELESHLRKG